MSHAGRLGLTLALAVVVGIAIAGLGTQAQGSSYTLVEGWAKLPAGMEWGQVISVDPDPDGRHIWAFHRAEPPCSSSTPTATS